MTPTSLLAALAGLTAAGGLVLAVAGTVGWSRPATVRRRGRIEQRLRAWLLSGGGGRGRRVFWEDRRYLLAVALAVGLGVWGWTAWPFGGLVAGVAVAGLPWMLRPGAGARAQIARLEALEEWVRRLSDVHTVGISLEQAVHASLRTAPGPLKAEVTRLVSRLSAGWRPTDAYRALADELDDATADQVVALMVLHADDRGAGLSRALQGLAASLADEVLMRREVEADREKPRTNARWVTIFCLIVFAASMLSGSYVAPYGTAVGQLLLALLVCGFVATLVWMRRMANMTPAPRFLSATDRSGGPPQAPARRHARKGEGW